MQTFSLPFLPNKLCMEGSRLLGFIYKAKSSQVPSQQYVLFEHPIFAILVTSNVLERLSSRLWSVSVGISPFSHNSINEIRH